MFSKLFGASTILLFSKSGSIRPRWTSPGSDLAFQKSQDFFFRDASVAAWDSQIHFGVDLELRIRL
jgi:hypothetical protein